MCVYVCICKYSFHVTIRFCARPLPMYVSLSDRDKRIWTQAPSDTKTLDGWGGSKLSPFGGHLPCTFHVPFGDREGVLVSITPSPPNGLDSGLAGSLFSKALAAQSSRVSPDGLHRTATGPPNCWQKMSKLTWPLCNTKNGNVAGSPKP